MINRSHYMSTTRRPAGSLRTTAIALALTGAVTLAMPVAYAPLALIGTAYADADLVVEKLSYDTGFGIIGIPRLEANGATVSADELKAMLTGKGVGKLSDQLARLTARSIYIPEITFDQKMAGVEQKISYLDISLIDVANGKIGRMKIGKATFDSSIPVDPATAAAGGAGSLAMTGEMAAMSADGVDLAGMVRVFSEKATGDNEPMISIYDSYAIEGYRINTAGIVDISLGRMSGHEFKMRPMKVPFAELMSSLPKPNADGAPPSPEEAKTLMAMMKNFVDIYYAFSMKDAVMEDFRASMAGTPPGSEMFKLDRITMADYADAKLGEFVIEGFNISPPGQGVIKFGTMSLKGLDLHKTLTGVISMMDQLAAADPAAPPPQPTPDQLAQMMPTFEAFEIADMKLDFVPPADPLNASPAPVRMELGRFAVAPKAWLGFIPTSLEFTLDGFKMAVDPNDPKMAQLVAFGITDIDLSSKIDYAWDEAANRLSINDLNFDWRGFGKFSAQALLDGVTKDAFSADPLVQQAAMGAALVKKLGVEIENSGMIEAMLAQQATQQGKSVEDIKKEMIAAAAGGIPAFLGSDPKAIDIGNAISKFVADPKKLKISAELEAGIGMLDMFAPDQILKKATIEATAN